MTLDWTESNQPILMASNRVHMFGPLQQQNIHPFDIGIYRDTILWSDWAFRTLVTMNIYVPNYASLTGSLTFERSGGLHIQYGEWQSIEDPVFFDMNKELYHFDDVPFITFLFYFF